MSDDTEEIRKKIQKAKTDSLPFPSDSNNLESRPEIHNLLNIFSSISEKNIDVLINEYSGKDFKKFKEDLFEVINNKISVISSEMKKLLSDPNLRASLIVLDISSKEEFLRRPTLFSMASFKTCFLQKSRAVSLMKSAPSGSSPLANTLA